jgi:hypothetical protein
MEFGFFRGLPENLFIMDIVGQVAFLLDIVLQFFVAYRDSQTYRMIYKRSPIALRLVSLLFAYLLCHANPSLLAFWLNDVQCGFISVHCLSDMNPSA